MPKISVIIPCYYNEDNIPVTFSKLKNNEAIFQKKVDIEYVFVDDGSKDKTWEKLLEVKSQHPDNVKIIRLAGNVGSYNAVLAGMEYATGDCNVIIAADLQDPPELMLKMYDYWAKGVKLVIGHRTDRNDSFLTNLFSNTFHFLIKKFALSNVPSGGFDYVLFDRNIKNQLLELKEKNSNIFYLMVWMGFDYVSIPYVRQAREIGTSRWTLSKKIKLFIDSFVAFSFFPLRLITITGLLLGFSAFVYGLFIVYSRYTGYIDVEGWSALMVVLLFVSSFQMISIGIIGEYVWRTADAARNRPLYIAEEIH